MAEEIVTFKGREVPRFEPGPNFVRPRGWGYFFPMGAVLGELDEDDPAASLRAVTEAIRNVQPEIQEYLKLFLRLTGDPSGEVEHECDELEQIIDEMETFWDIDENDDLGYANNLLHALYDWADSNRVWMEPTGALA